VISNEWKHEYLLLMMMMMMIHILLRETEAQWSPSSCPPLINFTRHDRIGNIKCRKDGDDGQRGQKAKNPWNPGIEFMCKIARNNLSYAHLVQIGK